MGEREWLADRFEEHRAHLRAVAAKILEAITTEAAEQYVDGQFSVAQ